MTKLIVIKQEEYDRLQKIEYTLRKLLRYQPEFGLTLEYPEMCRTCNMHQDGLEEYIKNGVVYVRPHIPHREDCRYNELLQVLSILPDTFTRLLDTGE